MCLRSHFSVVKLRGPESNPRTPGSGPLPRLSFWSFPDCSPRSWCHPGNGHRPAPRTVAGEVVGWDAEVHPGFSTLQIHLTSLDSVFDGGDVWLSGNGSPVRLSSSRSSSAFRVYSPVSRYRPFSSSPVAISWGVLSGSSNCKWGFRDPLGHFSRPPPSLYQSKFF